MVDSTEGRQFYRMTIDCQVMIRQSDQHSPFVGIAKNLSATGLSFTCATALSTGDILQIEIAPGKDGVTPPFCAEVKVIHVEELVAEQSYVVGCEVIKMNN